jgi:hypothetical protein
MAALGALLLAGGAAVAAEQVWAGTKHRLTVVVDSTKASGGAWDAFGGLPDLALCYTGDEGKVCIPGGKSTVSPGEPAFCQDALTCIFAIEARGADILLEIVDVDLTANDPVGAGLCRPGGTCRVGSASVTFR